MYSTLECISSTFQIICVGHCINMINKYTRTLYPTVASYEYILHLGQNNVNRAYIPHHHIRGQCMFKGRDSHQVDCHCGQLGLHLVWWDKRSAAIVYP